MKRIIPLVISLLLLLNSFSIMVSAVTNILIESVYPVASVDPVTGETTYKSNYSVGDKIYIKGTCSIGKDIVLRIYDEKNSLICTDILLAHENNGTFLFEDFTVPPTSSTGTLNYKVVVSESEDDTPAEQTMTVIVTTTRPGGGGGGGGGSTATPTVQWTDSVEKIADNIGDVTTEQQAEKTIEQITNATKDGEALKDDETRNNIATAVETMAANISAKTVSRSSSNSLSLTESIITSADLAKVDKTMAALQATISKNKLELNRDLFKELVLKVKFDATKKATITISQKLIDVLKGIDILTISDTNFKVSYKVTDLILLLGENKEVSVDIEQPKDTDKSTVSKVNINFNTDKTNTIKVSFDGIKGDTTYMAVVDENGNAVGGKYNPVTKCIEAKISESGAYRVVNNEKDFADIKNKSSEMQKAIKVLASKGIIQGTSETEFAPDNSITRAEIAALVLRVLAKIDLNADGGFVDVKSADWYFGTAGSAKKYGIINGFEDNTFRGNNVIIKDQILAISARILRNEMRYKTPENIEEWLVYADRVSIAQWALSDLALASMANLITKTTDNRLNPSAEMSRGDASIIIMKLFDKIW